MKSTVNIVQDGKEWLVPRGFGAAYKRELQRSHKTSRVKVARDLLSLIGYHASPEVVSAWPLQKQIMAIVYSANVHARASDNAVQAHPKPEWLPDPWQGAPRGEGVFHGPGPTELKQ